MALCATALNAERLFSVMACAALFAFTHGCHGKGRFLHRKNLCVAVVAFETLVCVYLPAEGNITHRGIFKYNCLSRRYRKSGGYKSESYDE